MRKPEIRVGILSRKELKFRLCGSFSDRQKSLYHNCDFTAHIQDNKIVLASGGMELFVDSGFSLQPCDFGTSSFSLTDVAIGIGFHWEKKEEQVFRGDITLLIESEIIEIINVLPVEEYLVSVISSEMRATSSLQMLKAHAVISRGWVLAQINKNTTLHSTDITYKTNFITNDEIVKWYDREDHTLFDVCADDHCQRYQGITRASTAIVEDAVRQTSGEVLTYNEKLCDTRFSKCCGGVTELFENTWEPQSHPYLQRIYDNNEDGDLLSLDLTYEENAKTWIMTKPVVFCNTTDNKVLAQVLNDYDQKTHDFFRWKVDYSGEELGELIKSKTGIDFGIICDLLPLQRGVSGRIIRLLIVGSKKKMVIGKELEIRKALSKTHLYSSAFIVERIVEGDSYHFTLYGAGWGHGVGLCQIGAAVMGAKGFSYKEILGHYYRGAEIKKIY
jgi:stage II sporulation protein D